MIRIIQLLKREEEENKVTFFTNNKSTCPVLHKVCQRAFPLGLLGKWGESPLPKQGKCSSNSNSKKR
jgi:hypothetical protein